MDPSHRMICSYTWLTELSSINKHPNTSTCGDTHGRFLLFSELRLPCAASTCIKKEEKKKSSPLLFYCLFCTSNFPLAVNQRHLRSDVYCCRLLRSSSHPQGRQTRRAFSLLYALFSYAHIHAHLSLRWARRPRAGRGISCSPRR